MRPASEQPPSTTPSRTSAANLRNDMSFGLASAKPCRRGGRRPLAPSPGSAGGPPHSGAQVGSGRRGTDRRSVFEPPLDAVPVHVAEERLDVLRPRGGLVVAHERALP